MPANLITLPHFLVSSTISLPNWAGDPGSGVPPTSARRVLILGSASAALHSGLLTGVEIGHIRINSAGIAGTSLKVQTRAAVSEFNRSSWPRAVARRRHFQVCSYQCFEAPPP